jgi:hypothetical protein
MEGVLVILAVLACPLMMLAMGGMAWVAARFRDERADAADDAQELPRPASHQTDGLAGRR